MLFTSLALLHTHTTHLQEAMDNAIIYKFLVENLFNLAFFFFLIQEICVPTKGKIVF